MNNLTIVDVANYFLILVDREAGDNITQLKLQKLIYFAQGISLSLLGKPIFDEDIEAWEHGPVVRDLRKHFGEFGKEIIPMPADMSFDIYSDIEKALIYKVYSYYGEHTASYLRKLTHDHSIWQEAFDSDTIIDQDKIKLFFSKLIDSGKIAKDFLLMSLSDKHAIANAEDEWY